MPAPPEASFEAPKPKAGTRNVAFDEAFKTPAKRRILLDVAFLKRVYGANLWFGVVLALTVGLIGQSFVAALSSLAGLLTGLLFLKTQELFVARLLRAKTGLPISDSWRFFPTWLLVPGKYVLLIAAILLLRKLGLMNYVTFVGGCLAVQLILLLMACERLLSRRAAAGTAAEKVGKMLREVYVAPHQMKQTEK